jgi:hypothetical protein
VLLKEAKISPFEEHFWKIKIQQQRKMSSMHIKMPRVKKSSHLLSISPLIAQKTTKMEEKKGKFIAFDLKIRAGQHSDATKYKNYVGKFDKGNPQNG